MRLRATIAVALLAALASAIPGTAGAATGYHSACGIELSSNVPSTPGGPTCGTDEGDDTVFNGEPSGITFFGENGHDTVAGSPFDDVVQGGPGNDEVYAERGNDYIDGGDDSDTLFGGLGDDTIRERRFGVNEHLYGGPGNDIVAGGRGGDDLFGGTGNDVLIGGSGSDRLYGGPGDDTLYGGPNRDTFDCGPGDDTVYRVRHSSPDRLSTGRADGSIPKSAGCEHIVNTDPTGAFPLRQIAGHDGNDTLAGGSGDDFIEGKGGSDRLFGGGGQDELEGDGATAGNDLLMGGSGSDRLAGRSGNDKLYGDARSPNAGPPGNDELVGGSGHDLMVGGPGDDLIAGAYDGDRILAGTGNDIITLLGGDTNDPNGRVDVNCGRGFDVVAINPARRGVFRGCEAFTSQFHEADFGHFFHPSSEVWPPGVPNNIPGAAVAAAARSRAKAARSRPATGQRGGSRSQATPLSPAPPDGGATAPSLSADGSRVAFSSDADNLVAGDSNGARTDPFVRDMNSGKNQLADSRRSGASATRGARLRRGPSGAISADGRFTVFTTNTPDLAGHVPAYAIFRRDLMSGQNQRACRAGNADSVDPVISADGQHVAFESRATNLSGADKDLQPDVYWCDMRSGALARVSVPVVDSVNSVGSSQQPSISGDGRYVAFTSDGGGLVPGDGTRAGVYWRDVATGETRLVDVLPGATSSDGSGENPKISSDGRFVVFDSDATDLPGGDLNGRAPDVFRKDVVTGDVALVSQGKDGSGANGTSTADSISGDGSVVVFSSSASNLVLGDGNGTSDVFAKNLNTGVTTMVSAHSDGSGLAGPSTQGAISADGHFVAFSSRASGVVAGEAPTSRPRIYRRDLASGALVEVSAGLNLPPSSLVGEPFGVNLRRKVHLIAGTSEDNGRVTSVKVAVSRSVGNGKCAWLTRGGRLKKAPCSKPLFLSARVLDGLRWTLRVAHLLPRGTYSVRAQAVDDTGLAERFRTGRNVTSFGLK
jgi:Tol biopolymer transport system component